MPLDPEGEVPNPPSEADAEELALRLIQMAGDQSVRVVEALAATLTNAGDGSGEASPIGPGGPADPSPAHGLCEDPIAVDDFGRRLGLCRRIARRALRGSLADPTCGATAFHRIDEGPEWARDLLPVATFGPYLFYRK